MLREYDRLLSLIPVRKWRVLVARCVYVFVFYAVYTPRVSPGAALTPARIREELRDLIAVATDLQPALSADDANAMLATSREAFVELLRVLHWDEPSPVTAAPHRGRRRGA